MKPHTKPLQYPLAINKCASDQFVLSTEMT